MKLETFDFDTETLTPMQLKATLEGLRNMQDNSRQQFDLAIEKRDAAQQAATDLLNQTTEIGRDISAVLLALAKGLPAASGE